MQEQRARRQTYGDTVDAADDSWAAATAAAAAAAGAPTNAAGGAMTGKGGMPGEEGWWVGACDGAARLRGGAAGTRTNG